MRTSTTPDSHQRSDTPDHSTEQHQAESGASSPLRPRGPLRSRDVMRLQRRMGNAAVRRMLMTEKEWKARSTKTGRFRSAELLAIDQALVEYNRSEDLPPDRRLEKLETLSQAIQAWEASKEQRVTVSEAGATSVTPESRRAEVVNQLKEMIGAERDRLGAASAQADVSEPTGARTTAQQLFAAATRLAQRSILTRRPLEAKPIVEMLADTQQHAEQATTQARTTLDEADDPAQANALALLEATEDAIRTLHKMAQAHMMRDASLFAAVAADIDDVADTIDFLDVGAGQAATKTQITAMLAALDDLRAQIEPVLADAPAGPSGEGDQGGDPLELVGQVTTMTGYVGTDGKGNTGAAEFYRGEVADPQSSRDRSQNQVREMFSGGESLEQADKNAISGISDIGGAAAGAIGDAADVRQAWATLHDPNATDKQKLDAKLTLAEKAPALLSRLMAGVGGVLNIAKGSAGELENEESFFFHTHPPVEGVDASTDVKLVGDIMDWVASTIGAIKDTLDLFHHMSGAGRSAKQQVDDTRHKAENIGNSLLKLTKVGKGWAQSHTALTKLTMQIQGGGTIADPGAVMGQTGNAAPIAGLIFSIMDSLHNAYKLTRLRGRRDDLMARREALLEDRADTTVSTVEAVELSIDTLEKRVTRVGINLGHNLVNIVAGGFNVSAIGAAPGMIINLASMAGKVGQVGWRTAKHALRERKSKSRSKKDEARGFHEPFADWKRRKQAEAARAGRSQQILTAIDIAFTPNWSKTKAAKQMNAQAAARHLLELNDEEIFVALGCAEELEAAADRPDKIAIIVAQLRKRD